MATAAKGKKGAVSRRERKNIAEGIVFIYSTFNNTLVTVSDKLGNVLSWSSAGVMGFKGSRKSTPFAAQNALTDAVGKAKEHGLRKVEVRVNGPGPGRESALRALAGMEVEISKIVDVTPVPHNGCKPPKRRRV
jgi:small subunit ribosomal protein S11